MEIIESSFIMKQVTFLNKIRSRSELNLHELKPNVKLFKALRRLKKIHHVAEKFIFV